MSNATKCRHPCMGPSLGEGEDHLWFNFRISHLAWTNKWYILTIFSWLSRLLKIILYSTELKSILKCWTLSLNTLHCRICSWVSLNKKQVLHHMLSLNDDFWLSLTLIVLDLIQNKVLSPWFILHARKYSLNCFKIKILTGFYYIPLIYN